MRCFFNKNKHSFFISVEISLRIGARKIKNRSYFLKVNEHIAIYLHQFKSFQSIFSLCCYCLFSASSHNSSLLPFSILCYSYDFKKCSTIHFACVKTKAFRVFLLFLHFFCYFTCFNWNFWFILNTFRSKRYTFAVTRNRFTIWSLEKLLKWKFPNSHKKSKENRLNQIISIQTKSWLIKKKK